MSAWLALFSPALLGNILLCSIGAWLIVSIVIRHALQFGLVQAPNHRSSHVAPTPTGGGVGIVAATSICTLAWLNLHPTLNSDKTWLTLLVLSLFLAAVGLWDDMVSLKARWRFIVQIGVCTLATLLFSSSTSVFPTQLIGGFAVLGLIIGGVWWINLFNFMDGIDGLAGAEAVFILLSVFILGMNHSATMPIDQAAFILLIAAATIGFLIHNWPRARVFMGDVGSTYLAFMIFGLYLLSLQNAWLSTPTWLICAGVFIVDSTCTLLRRISTRQSWTQAHRSHAYQKLARRWSSHRKVTIGIIAINVFWLLPWAWGTLIAPEHAWLHVVLAYLPLCILARIIGAGKPDHA